MHTPSLVVALAAATSAFGLQLPSGLRRRDDTCEIRLANSNGGRYIGIVIDSSSSMSSTDPNDVRIPAGKELNKQLVTSAAAGGSLQADKVTVVDFDGSASVIYALGDPAGADSTFDQIDSNGSTDIAAGIDAAIVEITAAGDISGKAGIVVLTDGGSYLPDILDALEKAKTLGIRVSFGFLGDSTSSFSTGELEQGILKTGGTFMTFDDAENIRPWLFLLLSNGLTAADTTVENGAPLLPGITVAKLTGADAVPFTYAAQDAEGLVFTVTSLTGQELSAELKDASGATLGSNSTDSAAGLPAIINFSSQSKGDLKLLVSSSNSTDEGVIQVHLNSTLGISGCSLNNTAPPTKNNTGPRPGNNGTATSSSLTLLPTSTPGPTSTSTPPPVPAGAAAVAAQFGFVAAGFAAALFVL